MLFCGATFMDALQAALDERLFAVHCHVIWDLVFNFFIIILMKLACFCLKIAADVVRVFVQEFAVKPAVFLLDLPVDFSQYGDKAILELIFCQRLICC
jgi:hypothetical protein